MGAVYAPRICEVHFLKNRKARTRMQCLFFCVLRNAKMGIDFTKKEQVTGGEGIAVPAVH